MNAIRCNGTILFEWCSVRLEYCYATTSTYRGLKYSCISSAFGTLIRVILQSTRGRIDVCRKELFDHEVR